MNNLKEFEKNYNFLDEEERKKFEEYYKYFTEKYKYVMISGKPSFVKEFTDLNDGKIKYEYSSSDAVKEFFADKTFRVKASTQKGEEIKKLSFIKELIYSNYLNRFHGLVFNTTKEREYILNDERFFNVWTGFVEPKKGSVKPFFRLLKDVLIATKEERKHIIKLMAYSVKFPNEKIENGIVLKGPQGAGKTSISSTFKAICPNHTTEIKDIENVKGFNADLINIKYFLFEEATWGGNKTLEGWLKTFLTSSEIRIEPKSVNAFTLKNISFSIFTTNNDYAVPIGEGDRRYSVFEASSKLKGNNEYFKKYYEWLFGEGKHHLVYFFQNMNFDNFNPRKVIENKAKSEMAIHNYETTLQFLISFFDNDLIDIKDYYNERTKRFEIKRDSLFELLEINYKNKYLNKREFTKKIATIMKFDEIDSNWRDNWKNKTDRYFYFKPLEMTQDLIAKYVNTTRENLFKKI
jgi:hypothetical protein